MKMNQAQSHQQVEKLRGGGDGEKVGKFGGENGEIHVEVVQNQY